MGPSRHQAVSVVLLSGMVVQTGPAWADAADSKAVLDEVVVVAPYGTRLQRERVPAHVVGDGEQPLVRLEGATGGGPGLHADEVRALRWEHVDLTGNPHSTPPVPPSISVLRSARQGGDTKTGTFHVLIG